jgi:hypothetical protein
MEAHIKESLRCASSEEGGLVRWSTVLATD